MTSTWMRTKGFIWLKQVGASISLNHGATWFILVLKLIILVLCKEGSSIGEGKKWE